MSVLQGLSALHSSSQLLGDALHFSEGKSLCITLSWLSAFASEMRGSQGPRQFLQPKMGICGLLPGEVFASALAHHVYGITWCNTITVGFSDYGHWNQLPFSLNFESKKSSNQLYLNHLYIYQLLQWLLGLRIIHVVDTVTFFGSHRLNSLTIPLEMH